MGTKIETKHGKILTLKIFLFFTLLFLSWLWLEGLTLNSSVRYLLIGHLLETASFLIFFWMFLKIEWAMTGSIGSIGFMITYFTLSLIEKGDMFGTLSVGISTNFIIQIFTGLFLIWRKR